MFKKIIIAFAVILVVGIIVALRVAPKIAESSMNVVSDHQPYKISAQAKELHKSLTIGDWHADSLLWKRDLSKRAEYGHLDIPRLQAGNVSLQMFTTVTKSPSGLNYAENSASCLLYTSPSPRD